MAQPRRTSTGMTKRATAGRATASGKVRAREREAGERERERTLDRRADGDCEREVELVASRDRDAASRATRSARTTERRAQKEQDARSDVLGRVADDGQEDEPVRSTRSQCRRTKRDGSSGRVRRTHATNSLLTLPVAVRPSIEPTRNSAVTPCERESRFSLCARSLTRSTRRRWS